MFAAASLTAAFTKLGEDFSAANGGTKVVFNFAGSQALATQIQQAAPADVFASADITNMDKVKDLVNTAPELRQQPAGHRGREGQPQGRQGPRGPGQARPEGGPGGRGGAGRQVRQQVLDEAGVSVTPVSQEDNVKAVVTKVSLGEADAGIVYVTDVTAGGDKVEGVDIPEEQNVVATYPIATVKASKAPDKAQAFMDLVLSAEGQQVLKEYGFLPPPTT